MEVKYCLQCKKCSDAGNTLAGIGKTEFAEVLWEESIWEVPVGTKIKVPELIAWMEKHKFHEGITFIINKAGP